MMKHNSILIVIPVYKMHLTLSEKKSLQQCFKVLENHPISFIHPSNFDFSVFCNLNHVESKRYKIKNISFPPQYFEGISGYNRLLMSVLFYKKFIAYNYILIYQLDAWVFKDLLDIWIKRDYDYVGAPWRGEQVGEFLRDKVGNGGLSLRKVQSHLQILENIKFNICPIYSFNELLNQYVTSLRNEKKSLNIINLLKIAIKSFVRFFGYRNNLGYIRKSELNEDVFWCIYSKHVFRNFKIPPADIAKEFSLETNPRQEFHSLGTLPFGCHAWEKWDQDFWKDHIL